MTIDIMSTSLNTLADELRQEYKVVLIKINNDLTEREREDLWFYFADRYDAENIPRNPLSSLQLTGKIPWTDVGSLKEALRAIQRDKLASDLEEYEMKRDLAFVLDTYAKNRQGLNQKESCLSAESMIEHVAEYLAKIADGVLDKDTVKSLRKSRKNLRDLMNDLETGIDDKLSNAWSKLALLIVIVGEVIAETETTKEEFGQKPKVLKSFSTEICSRMKRQVSMEEFCQHVKQRFNEVYNDHDSNGNTTSSKKIVVDAVDQFMKTPFFQQPSCE
ncbi:uncharacterized protein [Montipora capricornis]|uniref:uncharacterized protein n=1 Tax=Montipora foliosa TaxID=591990 RepID=UPI0035F130F7